MPSSRTLLIVEDNPGDARLICEMLLEDKTAQDRLIQAGTLDEAEQHLASHAVDLVLLDLGLPDAQGLDAVKRIRIAAPDIPLVVMTGMDDDELAARSLRHGAQDYLIKGQIEGRGLLRTLRHAGERNRLERLKNEFVSSVSHELRTPLTSIIGSLRLLARETAGILPGPAARLLTIATTNCNRLVRLINDILDTEKLESGRLAFSFNRIDARSIVEKVVEADRGFAEDLGVQIHVSGVAGGIAYVRADADRLTQAISNLLSNAVKFSTQVVVAVEKEADVVRISVRDHGPGISADFRARIFEKFAQADGTDARRKGGTGLGLYIVKQIVDQLGGKISFVDGLGDGTIFRIELPTWESIEASLHAEEIETDAPAQLQSTLERLAETARDSLALALGNGGSVARPGSRDSYR